MAREQDQSQSPITLPRLKPPEKGCHPVHCHSHRTRSRRSQPRRDADRAGWRGQANALSAVTVRHADIESAWVSLSPAAQILCPTAFSSQVPGRKKTLTEDWNSRNGSSQSRWAQHQRGISPSMTHTQIECHPCAGETCMSYNDGAAFATTPWNVLFCEALWMGWRWLSWALGWRWLSWALGWRWLSWVLGWRWLSWVLWSAGRNQRGNLRALVRSRHRRALGSNSSPHISPTSPGAHEHREVGLRWLADLREPRTAADFPRTAGLRKPRTAADFPRTADQDQLRPAAALLHLYFGSVNLSQSCCGKDTGDER